MVKNNENDKSIKKKRNSSNKTSSKVTNKNEIKEEEIVELEDSKEMNEKKQKKEKKGFFVEKYSMFDVLFFLILAVLLSVFLTRFYMNKTIRSNVLLNTLNNIRDKEVNEFVTTYNEIVDNYYEDINKEELITAAIDGMTSYLGDNYTDVLNKDETNDFMNSLSGTYKGIGIELRINEVTKVFKSTPAEKAGIKVGDIVKSMNGLEITEENFGEVFKEIDIASKKKIELVVVRDDKEYNYNLEVKTINLPVVTSDYIELDGTKIGYVKISSFTKNSPDLLKDILKELDDKDVKKIIFDLRDNSGGYLDVTEKILSMLLKKGEVIYSYENKAGKEKVIDKTKESKDYEMVVLINGITASSSEIFAAALRDNNSAVIVGEKSYGKGKIQNTMQLKDGSLFKYTKALWYTPNGDSIDGVGIIPNYEVHNKDDNDLQYDKALEILK